MILKRTTSKDRDFQTLVILLDRVLSIADGNDHSFYSQFNKIDKLNHVVVIYENEVAVGCGAFKEYDAKSVEIKRMFVLPENRGKGIAAKVLTELEHWANELGYSEFVLETGKSFESAVALYKKAGYAIIPNYGQYENVERSVCMKKIMK